MRIPVRYAPVVFGALLSIIMVALVSAFVIAITQGIQPGFADQWLRSCLTTWPVAFPTVTLLAPWVRRVVGRMVSSTDPMQAPVALRPADSATTGGFVHAPPPATSGRNQRKAPTSEVTHSMAAAPIRHHRFPRDGENALDSANSPANAGATRIRGTASADQEPMAAATRGSAIARAEPTPLIATSIATAAEAVQNPLTDLR